MERGEFRLIQYPSSRLGTIDLGVIGGRKHHVAGLIEIDVTDALRAEGPVFFFAWVVGMIGRCIAEDRSVHALRGRGRQLVLFDSVDITVIVEKKVEGYRVPLPLVIREAERKSTREIHQEIRHAQRQSVQDEGDYVLAGGGEQRDPERPTRGPGLDAGSRPHTQPSARAMRVFYRLPGRIRVAMMLLILKNPFRAKAMMGTVVVTSIGSVGRRRRALWSTLWSAWRGGRRLRSHPGSRAQPDQLRINQRARLLLIILNILNILKAGGGRDTAAG